MHLTENLLWPAVVSQLLSVAESDTIVSLAMIMIMTLDLGIFLVSGRQMT